MAREKNPAAKKPAPRKKPSNPVTAKPRKPTAKKPALRRRDPEPASVMEPVQGPVAPLPPPIIDPFQR